MLQLRTSSDQAKERLRAKLPFPPRWRTPEELQETADSYIEAFLEERFNASRELGGAYLLFELFDRSLRTSERERMDAPHMPAGRKLEMIRALDRMNGMLMLYRHYCGIVEPCIREVSERKRRPARVLELAGGAGGLAFALAEQAAASGLETEITGSDIVPEYVAYCNRKAENRRLPVTFEVIDAFSIGDTRRNSWDIVIVSQSLHHFTPGRIARIIHECSRLGASVFLGLDGYRSAELLAGVPLIAVLQGMKDFMLDGYTSARKFYSEAELDLIAETAVGPGRHSVRSSWPLSVLEVALAPS